MAGHTALCVRSLLNVGRKLDTSAQVGRDREGQRRPRVLAPTVAELFERINDLVEVHLRIVIDCLVYTHGHHNCFGGHSGAGNRAEATNAQREISRRLDPPYLFTEAQGVIAHIRISHAGGKHVVAVGHTDPHGVVGNRRRHRLGKQAGGLIGCPSPARFPWQDRQHGSQPQIILTARNTRVQLGRNVHDEGGSSGDLLAWLHRRW